jgi:hypothetical protein
VLGPIGPALARVPFESQSSHALQYTYSVGYGKPGLSPEPSSAPDHLSTPCQLARAVARAAHLVAPCYARFNE